MPTYVNEGKSILSFLSNDVSTDTYVNLMEQYRPTFKGCLILGQEFWLGNSLKSYLENSSSSTEIENISDTNTGQFLSALWANGRSGGKFEF